MARGKTVAVDRANIPMTIPMPFGSVENWTIRNIAEQRLAECADRPFIEQIGGGSESYRTFICRAAALSHVIADIGMQRGSTLGILCTSSIAALHGWMAAALIGVIDVTIHASYRGEILRHLLNVTKPAVIMVERSLLPQLEEVMDDCSLPKHLIIVGDDGTVDWTRWSGVDVLRYEDIVATPASTLPDREVKISDPASVMFTSGTTGPSKGVVMPNAHVCSIAYQVIVNTRLSADDVYYCVHPLNHIAGKFMGVLASFAMGARLVLDKRFEAGCWLENVRSHGVTLSIAHGPMVEMIHATPPTPFDADHAMRRLMCSPLPKAIGEEFEKRFGLRGIEMWGMTEIGCPCWTPFEGYRPHGTCGTVMHDWYDVKIVDPETDRELPHGEVGEIVVRPHVPWTIMAEYMSMPEQTLKAWRNLWFHTGDAARRDEAGHFFIVDRVQDRIRRRAENISSYDIEAAALSFPGIREAAAVGVSSGMEGDDDIKLCVACEATFEPVDLLRHLAANLPHFMVPRYIEIVPALPRTPTNKVRKRVLRDAGISDATWDRQTAGISLRDLIASIGGSRRA